MKSLDRKISIKDVLFILVILILICIILYVLKRPAPDPEIRYVSEVTKIDLKDIGKLVTQEGYYTSVQSIDGSRKLWGVDIPLTAKKFVYSYDGVVSAGINFERIVQQIDEENNTITVTLPIAEIYNVSADPNSFKVYFEANNPFNGFHFDEFNESRKEMEDEIREKAIESGILKHASENAKLLVKTFIENTYDQNVWKINIKQEGTR